MMIEPGGRPEAQLLVLALQLTEADTRISAGYRVVDVHTLRDFIGFALPSGQSLDDGSDGEAGGGDAVHHVFPYGVRFQLLQALETQAEPSDDPNSPWTQALAGLREDVADASADDRPRLARALTYAEALDDALSGASTREEFLLWLSARANRLGRVHGSPGFAVAAQHVDAFLTGNGCPD
ncbi:hypothetical protein NQ038_14770 [Brevibacterium sp. 50QC2O2]|uniref:hypothetical protein n=1 Tax=unclassified Brevibacterium TaxID=2614124 RepID=UPI00211CBE52|nr:MULTISPECIES: hypothetical protein [unclassified Brevibacterium]MCQ9369013.1 hypothetical protein [Brevibacterium sp. 91QC2O2]MCQ9389895.1 hypothetical protein [Brevibacterium sp. 50QC2O2]